MEFVPPDIYHILVFDLLTVELILKKEKKKKKTFDLKAFKAVRHIYNFVSIFLYWQS